MFRKIKEMQGLIDASRKAIEESDGKIGALMAELNIAHRNNRVLLERKDKVQDVLDKIKELAECNTYGNAESVLGKIRELVRPDNQN